MASKTFDRLKEVVPECDFVRSGNTFLFSTLGVRVTLEYFEIDCRDDAELRRLLYRKVQDELGRPGLAKQGEQRVETAGGLVP